MKITKGFGTISQFLDWTTGPFINLLISLVTAECGDYVVEDYPDHTYLSTFKFVPQQDGQLERRIMENHKKHV